MHTTPRDTKPSQPAARCIACDSTEWASLHDDLEDYEMGMAVAGLSLIQCRSCRLVQLDPMPDQRQLEALYPESYCDHFARDRGLLGHAYRTFFRSRVRHIARLVPPTAAILDVGCSAGYLLSLLHAHNPDWDVAGVEMRAEAVEQGRQRGLNILHGAIETIDLPPDHYDLVLLNALIEHLRDPKALLERLRPCLKPGGKLYIATFNTDCLDFRVLGKYWGGLHFPRHTYLFNADNMAALLRRCGYGVREVRASASSVGWALGLQNLISARRTVARRGGRARFYFPLVVLFLPLAFVQRLLGRSAIMLVVAEKTAHDAFAKL